MVELAPLPTVLVSMGTDHHPFGRLSAWTESWLEARSEPVRCLVQEGSSPVPHGAEPLGLVPKDKLLRLMSESTVVVCQGGPGSICDARNCGFIPIVVPRLARHGEVVDDHQVSFTRHMARLGWVLAVESEADLHRELTLALADPVRVRRLPEPSPAEASARLLATRVERLDGHFRFVYPRRFPAALRGVVTTLRGIRA